jgi:hypothetical protein
MANVPTTEEGLAAWRAQRLGKPVNLKHDLAAEGVPSNGGGGPDSERAEPRHPLEGHKFNPMELDTGGNQDDQGEGSGYAAEDDNLQQQLAAANGRLGPAQRQLEELRAAVQALQQQNGDMAAKLAERDSQERAARNQRAAQEFNPLEGLSKEELEMLDPAALKMIEHVGRQAFSKAHGSIRENEEEFERRMSKRDEHERNNFIYGTAEALGLNKLGNDNKFNKFLAEDDSAALLLNSFTQSKDIATARMLEPRVRSMLKRFEKTTNSTRTPDPQDRASAHLARKPDAQSAGSQRGGHVSADQVRQITEQARRLARAGKHKESRELLASI